MNQYVCFECFKFFNRISLLKFYKYSLSSNDPYADKNVYVPSVRNRIRRLQANQKMFVYADSSNQCLYTFKPIVETPNDGKVFIVEESYETIPLDSHTTKLYESYVTHIIHEAVKKYCLRNSHKYTYSYRDESTFYTNVIDAHGREVYSQNLGCESKV
jgi:hypothetical protein